MKAVFYIDGQYPWAELLGDCPWPLLPFGSRPLLTYWFELCADLKIAEVQIVLGLGGELVEQFCKAGERWGLQISYSFLRPDDSAIDYLSYDPSRWKEGLLFLSGALFPRRQSDFSVERLQKLSAGACFAVADNPLFFVSEREDKIRRFIEFGECGPHACMAPSCIGLDFVLVEDVASYYELNMALVRSEMDRYLSSGYCSPDRAAIGYNVVIPPTVRFQPPLTIGNDCRLGSLCSVGPHVILSDHVLVDRQCELSDCMILSNTYVGKNLEIKGKIVSGRRIIDPADGSWLDIDDPWLVTQARSEHWRRDCVRTVFGWVFALVLWVVQAIPFAVFYGLIRLFRLGSFVGRPVWGTRGRRVRVSWFVASDVAPNGLLFLFYAASLDRFPQLGAVLRGQLHLCGQLPKACGADAFRAGTSYFPAVFTCSDAFADIDRQMDALYYAHSRSLKTDLGILRHALFAGWLIFSQSRSPGRSANF